MLEAGRRDCFVVRKEMTKCTSTKQSSWSRCQSPNKSSSVSRRVGNLTFLNLISRNRRCCNSSLSTTDTIFGWVGRQRLRKGLSRAWKRLMWRPLTGQGTQNLRLCFYIIWIDSEWAGHTCGWNFNGLSRSSLDRRLSDSKRSEVCVNLCVRGTHLCLLL